MKCEAGGDNTKQETVKASDSVSRIKHPPKLLIAGYFINDLEGDYLFSNASVLTF